MGAKLDDKLLRFLRGVESGDVVLYREHRTYGIGRFAERRHHSIANCLNDGAVMFANFSSEEGEMFSNQMIGRPVADAIVKRGGAAQIAKHQGDVFDRRVVTSA